MAPWKIVSVALVAAFIFGYQIADINAVAPVGLIKVLGPTVNGAVDSVLNSDQGRFFLAVASTMFFLGTTTGAVAGGVLGDKIGRRAASMTAYSLFAVGTCLEILLLRSGTVAELNKLTLTGGLFIYGFGRLLNGMGVGVAHVVILMYLLETVPKPQMRGFYGWVAAIEPEISSAGHCFNSCSMKLSSQSKATKRMPRCQPTTGNSCQPTDRIAKIIIGGLLVIPQLPESPVYIQLRNESDRNLNEALQQIDEDFSMTPSNPAEAHPRLSEIRATAQQITSSGRSLLNENTAGDTQAREAAAASRRSLMLAVAFVILIQLGGINVMLTICGICFSPFQRSAWLINLGELF